MRERAPRKNQSIGMLDDHCRGVPRIVGGYLSRGERSAGIRRNAAPTRYVDYSISKQQWESTKFTRSRTNLRHPPQTIWLP
jgi:hypothetical protein